jgi:hypothetical protein
MGQAYDADHVRGAHHGRSKIPSEVLHEAATFPDIAMLRTFEYPMSADFLNLVREVMSTVPLGDKT